ncbi:MAG: D-alanine--D-alanine ligase family protein [bacterium]
MPAEKKIQVALIFGGRSVEHEVSLKSALGIIKNIDRKKFKLLPVKINKQGKWFLFDKVERLKSIEDLEKNPPVQVMMVNTPCPGLICINTGNKNAVTDNTSVEPVDIVFPVVHGNSGEDGTLQGLLKMLNFPFVGCDVLASAVAMDKIIAKQLFFQNNVPSVDFIWFPGTSWKKSSDLITQGVKKEIGFPCFIKPANSGSSVGVFKAHGEKEFSSLIDKACQYDRKILVEKYIQARELECSVLGNDNPRSSCIGEIIPSNEFYDYEAKYDDNSTQLIIPADIAKQTANAIKSLAIKAFKTLDCSGMARVDFLLENKTNNLYVNEINSIPGFTPISMYPKLWKESGISYSELITRLIELAKKRHNELKNLKYYR